MKKIAIVGAVAMAVLAGGAMAQEKLRYNSGEGVIFTPRYQAATNPNEGHCVLRVWVDDKATVNIRGDQIGVRTLSGTMSRDEGSYCSGPLPINAENFRIESSNRPGGGRILDVSGPDRRNGYTGSVTIDDPRNGGQIYVLDVTWNNPRNAPGPVITSSMDEEQACQAAVSDQIRSRNGNRTDVDFRPNVRRESMGSGRERIRGGGWAQGRNEESARFGYECVVDDRSNRVISAAYSVQGQGVDRIR